MKPTKKTRRLERSSPDSAYLDGLDAFFSDRLKKVPKKFERQAEFWREGWDRAREKFLAKARRQFGYLAKK